MTRQCSCRAVVVGSGWHFTSGISYYTCRLANALAADHHVTAVPMRALIPRRLYPGAVRVGKHAPGLAYDPRVSVAQGVDWWGRGLLPAVGRLWAADPSLVVLQWWTGAVLHSYVLLALVARLRGARVVMEMHEVQDTGEASMRLVRAYTRVMLRPLLALVHGFVVHSSHDRDVMTRELRLRGRPVQVACHGPYDHHTEPSALQPAAALPKVAGVRRLLYFGTVRPYKGLEDLVQAFDLLEPDEVRTVELVVVGEVWEGWSEPDERIAASRHRDRILRVPGYVPDAEVSAWFSTADVVVLPYRRSSASGPLHIAMAAGLPVVVTRVGGLEEAAGDYAGTTFVPPADPEALVAALREVLAKGPQDEPFADPRTWEDAVAALHAAAGLECPGHMPAGDTRGGR